MSTLNPAGATSSTLMSFRKTSKNKTTTTTTTAEEELC